MPDTNVASFGADTVINPLVADLVGVTTLTFYAIRHKPTGHYLSKRPNEMGRGATFNEPMEVSQMTRHRQMPRLYEDARAAKIALGYWLKGKNYGSRDEDGILDKIEIVPVPSRKAEEMEVVPVVMVLPPPSA